MNAEDFVNIIKKEVLDNGFLEYKNMLNENSFENIKDPQWKNILLVFQSMNEEQKKALMLMTRLAIIDTISHLFGILDGSSLLEEYREDFSLTYGEKEEKLNGDLQEYFLANEEN